MHKVLVIILVPLLFSFSGTSQRSYITREGSVSFFSSAPLEDIRAENKRVQAVLDNSTGEINVRMRIEDFQFPRALMQKHFNEKYMESHIYPEARFSGFIEDFDTISDDQIPDQVTVRGALTIHGVTREVRINGRLEKIGPHYVCNAVFPVRVEDHDIRIPRIFTRNIAEVVEVTVNLRLAPVN